jgi:hypothetical protein
LLRLRWRPWVLLPPASLKPAEVRPAAREVQAALRRDQRRRDPAAQASRWSRQVAQAVVARRAVREQTKCQAAAPIPVRLALWAPLKVQAAIRLSLAPLGRRYPNRGVPAPAARARKNKSWRSRVTRNVPRLRRAFRASIGNEQPRSDYGKQGCDCHAERPYRDE